MKQKKRKTATSTSSTGVWLRIDANTSVLVASDKATPEYAEHYRMRLANYRKRFHRYD